ncbi:MAG: efflux RND transporter periplasmic adaptor subunit [Caldithrix sp.]|nr:efflux RND transporter periplasmic adaptor subunit [Caldithrix sp.]
MKQNIHFLRPFSILKQTVFLAIIVALLMSCGSGNKQEELRKLETERDALTAQIEQLKQEIRAANGETPDNLAHVSIQKLRHQRFDHYIEVQGTVESDNNILIPAQSSGVVKEIHVEEGQKVQKGQVLAELDAAILENNIAALEARLQLAETAFERQKRLWEKKIGSEMQYLQAKTEKEALAKQLAATREQYKLTKVTAPIDGTVDEILLKEGESVAAGFGTIRIVKLTALKITADLAEDYTGRVSPGDSVTVRLPILKRQFRTTIRAVSQVIDPRNRTFPIEIKLPPEAGAIQPNMLAILTIRDYSNEQALTVPVNIVQKTGDKPFLFTAEPNSEKNDTWIIRKKVVSTGRNYGEHVEITEGLQPGDQVVVVGFQDLGDGQMVMASVVE